MGKIDYLQIVLSKPSPTIYVPGETIQGSINLRVNERVKINAIKLIFNGHVQVQWEDWVISGRSRRKHLYTSSETNLKTELNLFGKAEQNTDLHLEEGDYSFPIHFKLPQNLPTSFEHAHARVRYSMRTVIDIPWSFNIYSAISFTVINLLDLNGLKPLAKKPVGLSDIKTVGCGPCRSDPISIKFQINKSAFVPGERIVFNASIDNKSKHDLTSVRVYLIQQVKVYAERKRKVYKKSMGFMALHKGVEAFTKQDWNGSYRVPATAPTLADCRILKISYFFHLVIDASGTVSHANDLSMPITVGTIPLQKVSVSGSKQKSVAVELPNESEYTFEVDNTEYDDPLPPYTYETAGEAMQSDLDYYKPFYVFYKDFSNV